MADKEPPYQLGQTSRVVSQIKQLFTRALRNGLSGYFAEAVREIVKHLKNDPVAFGDPWHRTRRDGGRVYYRSTSHLFIRYVVLKKNRSSCS